MVMINRRLGSFSINKIESGTHMGQTTCANTRKEYMETLCHPAYSACMEESQTNPSENCWAENIRGIAANAFISGRFARTILVIPAAPIAVPAEKLASAEKHIRG